MESSNDIDMELNEKGFYSERMKTSPLDDDDDEFKYSQTESDVSETQNSDFLEKNTPHLFPIKSQRIVLNKSTPIRMKSKSFLNSSTERKNSKIMKKSLFKDLNSKLCIELSKHESEEKSRISNHDSIFDFSYKKNISKESSSKSFDEKKQVAFFDNFSDDSDKRKTPKIIKNPFLNSKEVLMENVRETKQEENHSKSDSDQSKNNITSLKFIKKKIDSPIISERSKSEKYISQTWEEKKRKIALESPFGILKSYQIRQIIIKVNLGQLTV
jgi:hypothetical protein